MKEHTDFFEVNEGTLFSASTHERITDKNIRGHRRNQGRIKAQRLKTQF